MSAEGLPVQVGRTLLALVGIAFVGAVAYAQADAQDEHPTARLVYERDAEATRCPDEPELRDLVAARLGYVPFRDEAPVVVTTRIEGTPRGLRATVEARTADGTLTGRREIVSRTRDCQELARGVGLAISVAIDPFVLTGGAPPTVVDAGPSPDAEAPSTGDAETASTDPSDAGTSDADAGYAGAGALDASVIASDPEPARSDDPTSPEFDGCVLRGPRGAWLSIGGSVGVGFGAVPDPRPYFAVDIAADHPSYIVRGVLRADLPAEDTRPIGGDVRAWRLMLRADACGVYRFLFGCGGIGARLYMASGDDVANARSGVKLNFAVTPQVGVRLPLTDMVRLHAAFGVDLPLGPIALELDDRAVFREAQVSPYLEVGVVWWIP